jgi:flagellar protein FlaF
MTPSPHTGYAMATQPVRTDRGSEYALFARVTAGLRSVDARSAEQFPALARAVHDNRRLWNALADDLALEQNGLPVALKTQLIGLAGFVRRHSDEVLAGRAQVGVLVDINTAIMKGLRGEVEVAS